MKEKDKKIALGFLLIGFVSILVEIIFPIDYHPYYWWHAFIGFDYVFGIMGGFLLIFAAKKMIFPLLEREEDIYQRRDRE